MPTKLCPDCGHERPFSDFWKWNRGKYGLGTYCIKHAKIRNKGGRDLQARRERDRYYKYNLNDLGFVELLDFQDGHCALCPTVLAYNGPETHVDHKHGTKEARGLLCRRCNLLLGYAEADPEWFTRALHYLADPPVQRKVRHG